LIGVFHAQDKFSPVALREQPGEERRAKTTQMLKPRRTRREAGANLFHEKTPEDLGRAFNRVVESTTHCGIDAKLPAREACIPLPLVEEGEKFFLIHNGNSKSLGFLQL
jgi:hypothetical protein